MKKIPLIFFLSLSNIIYCFAGCRTEKIFLKRTLGISVLSFVPVEDWSENISEDGFNMFFADVEFQQVGMGWIVYEFKDSLADVNKEDIQNIFVSFMDCLQTFLNIQKIKDNYQLSTHPDFSYLSGAFAEWILPESNGKMLIQGWVSISKSAITYFIYSKDEKFTIEPKPIFNGLVIKL